MGLDSVCLILLFFISSMIRSQVMPSLSQRIHPEHYRQHLPCHYRHGFIYHIASAFCTVPPGLAFELGRDREREKGWGVMFFSSGWALTRRTALPPPAAVSVLGKGSTVRERRLSFIINCCLDCWLLGPEKMYNSQNIKRPISMPKILVLLWYFDKWHIT